MLECDVLIVGCGPAGASLALYLAQKNIKVIVAEKKKNLDTPVRCAEFVPVNIAGLFDFKISGINNRTDYLETYVAKNSSEKFSLISKTGAPGFILDRDIFINDIASKFTASGGRLLKGTKVISIQQNPGGFILDLSDLALKNNLVVKAKIIAGADGPLSLIGRIMGSSHKSFMPAIQQNPAIILKNTDCNKVFFSPYISCGYGWLFPKTDRVNLGVGAFLERKTGQHEKKTQNTLISIKDTLAAFTKHLEFSGILPNDVNPQQSVFSNNIIITNDNNAKTIPESLRRENKNGAKQDRPLEVCGQFTPAVTGLIPNSGIVENPGTKDGFILCGDAAGLCNPITGAGIYNAVCSARLASEVIAKALSLNDLSFLEETKEIYNSQFGNSINRALRKKLMQKNNWPCSMADMNGQLQVTTDMNSYPQHGVDSCPEHILDAQINWPEHLPRSQNRNYFGDKDNKDNIEFLELVRQTWVAFKDYWH